jgi:hypothetical protein
MYLEVHCTCMMYRAFRLGFPNNLLSRNVILQFTFREIGEHVKQYRIFIVGFPYKQYLL